MTIVNKIDVLRDLSSIIEFKYGDLSEASKSHIAAAIRQILSELSSEYGGQQVAEESEPVNQPKKRGRKKKSELEKITEEEVVADAVGTAPEAVEQAWEEQRASDFEVIPPDGEHGLDKRIGRLSTLDGLSTETCVKQGISPLLVANTVSKTGDHPFFKGSIAYMWYLPEDRRRHYMAGALNYEAEYKSFSDFCDPDAQREEWETMGIDMDFVSCLLTKDDIPVLAKEPQRVDEPEVTTKIKAIGGLGKIVESLGENGKPLVEFMARLGINGRLLEDLLTIVKKHNENPNEVFVPF